MKKTYIKITTLLNKTKSKIKNKTKSIIKNKT